MRLITKTLVTLVSLAVTALPAQRLRLTDRGVPVMAEAKMTGALPGKVLRGPGFVR